MRKLICITWIISLLIMTAGISCSAEENLLKNAETLKFKTLEDMDYNLDSEEVVVPGLVEIEYGELKAKGKNLYYNNKEKMATLDGNPKIIATHGDEIHLEMNHLKYDINAGTLKLNGACKVNGDRNNGQIEIITEEMVFIPEKNFLNTPGKVSVWFKKHKSETATEVTEDPQVNDGKKQKKSLKIDEFVMDSGPLNYSFKTGEIHAAGPLKIDFEGGYFNADNADGNLESKLMTFNGRVSGSAGGISIVADKVVLDYSKQEVDALGNVQIVHDNGHIINAENIHASYREGEKTLSVKKGLTAELKMNDKSPKDK